MSGEMSGSGKEAHIVDWRTAVADIGSLNAGDVIQGFSDISELDIFVDNIGRYLRSEEPTLDLPPTEPTSQGRPVYEGWHRSSTPPSVAMRPQYFVGRLENLSATIAGYLTDRRFPRVSLVLAAELYSSQEKAGMVIKECIVATSPVPAPREKGVLYLRPLLRPGPTFPIYRELEGSTAEAAVKFLRQESRWTRYQQVHHNLGRLMIGGSPGLGRHR